MAGRLLRTFTNKYFLTIGLVGITITDRYATCVSVQDFSKHPSVNPNTPSTSFLEFFKDDVLLVTKFCLEKYKFTHGDVVIFRSPYDHRMRVVRRVKGLAGDIMNIPEINDSVIIPQGYCWVEGDYRNSLNSRPFALIPMGLIQGKATRIIWPPNRIGTLEKTRPEGEIF